MSQLDKSTVSAQLRAALWTLVAIVGVAEMKREVQQALQEIEDKIWSSPGNR